MKLTNLLFLIFPLLSFGQNLFNQAEKVSKEYFDNGAVKIEKELKNRIQHGKTFFYFENGKRRIERNFKEGKAHGKTFWYHMNGQIGWEENYNEGIPEGKWLYYSDNGKLQVEKVFKEGKEISYTAKDKIIRGN